MKKKIAFALSAAALVISAPVVAQSDAPIRIVVPFAAGGPNDVVARIAAQYMAKPLGRNIIVENKPGATGAIGSQYVANADPDGNTLILASSSTMMAPITLKSAKFDPTKDFVPVDLISLDENLLVVHPSVEARSIKELVEYAHRHPGKLNYSTSGQGSSYHLGTELFNSEKNTKMTHVPYKGSAPAVLGLIAGEVDVQFQAVSQARQHIAAGKAIPLGIASRTRHDAYPDVPTIEEAAGLPNFEFFTWMGLFAPAGTPEAKLTELREALALANQDEDYLKRLRELGMRPVSESPEAINTRISSDLKKWGKVVESINLDL